MSVSAVTASPPIKTPEASEPKAPDVKPDADAADASAHQPVVLAPLPPGQGTRIDQLVWRRTQLSKIVIRGRDPAYPSSFRKSASCEEEDGSPGQARRWL